LSDISKKPRDSAGNDLIVICTAFAMMIEKEVGLSRPLRDVQSLSMDIYGVVNRWLANQSK